ncbi:SPAC2G11.14 [Ecytonucleospora hepatopenaei]|uniref:SPAC2G11.14 n=1 Tax=Ecytonucleospora hepatopenaei TaxID=646526 RepID=A0A1W0E5Q6_9MICR|nr:SPAC2G11.14 [Ecytonucleospora hepatopenaei]
MPEGSRKNVNFINLLVKTVSYKYNLKKYKFNKRPVEQMGYEVDDSHKFRNSVYVYEEHNAHKNEKKKIKMPENTQKIIRNNNLYAVDLVKWEDNIFDINNSSENNNIKKENNLSVETVEYVNKMLETNWEANIFYDEIPPEKPLVVYADDPNLIFEPVEKRERNKKKIFKSNNFEKPLRNKYNISLDKYYENETKTKTSLVAFGVQHSVPALKLHSDFFTLNLNKEQLRNFHKPQLKLPNRRLRFSRPLQISVGATVIKKPYEVSCNDLSSFLLFEYSEEYPLFITNPGMVSVKNRYYRKMDINDDHDQKHAITLEPEEEGPFLNYGEIPKGEFGECLDNNLFVAPVFKHKCSDFLIILVDNKLVYKKSHFNYVVGQELPKEEIFAPHSRKLTQFCKDLVKVLAQRLFAKGAEFPLNFFDSQLPYFSEAAKRKWLKEFADFHKKGKDTMCILKPNILLLGEEEMRKMITPENVCQYQSMLFGERQMEDLGFKILEEDDENMNYTPNWTLSRNFVNASNGKGLLQLNGGNDPTGIGEGYSFDKIKFKKYSENESRKLMSEHQLNYKNEVFKIWSKQWKSLSNSCQIPKPRTSENQPDCQQKTNLTAFETPNECEKLQIIRSFVENGNVVEKTEIITDTAVIKAYLKARKRVKVEDKKSNLKCSSCGQVGHMKTNKNCPNYIGSSKKSIKEKKKAKVYFQEKLLRLITLFQAIPYSAPFHRPVSDKKFPLYKKIIKNSMDFLTMKNKVKNGEYSKFDTFIEDLILIYENCKLFNGISHSLTEIASEFVEKAKNYKIENFIELSNLEAKIERDE